MRHLNISSQEVHDVLENHFNSKDFKIVTWKITSLDDTARLGFMGDHVNLEAVVQRHDSKTKVSFFIKVMPENEIIARFMEACSMFRKEFLFYRHIAPEMISVLSEIDPITSKSTSVIPKCSLVAEDMLIMEDLRVSNFRTIEAGHLPIDFFTVTVRSLARYHAASIVLENRLKKTLLEEFPVLDFETNLHATPGSYLAGFYKAYVNYACELVPMLDKYKSSPEVVKKVQAAIPDLLKETMEGCRAWPESTNVFCHGDLWKNNVLVRTDTAGKLIEAVLVDFQFMLYAPPAIDIVMFLLFNSNKDFRDNHSNEVIHEYYGELRRVLIKLGVQPDEVLPWEELLRTLKIMKKYGLILMTVKYPMILAPSELMAPILRSSEAYRYHYFVDRTKFMKKLFTECKEFRTRYSEVMEELIDEYILKS